VLVAARGIQFVDFALLLEHHRAGARIEGLDVEVRVVRELRKLLSLGIARPHVGDAIAIADEHDLVAEPRGGPCPSSPATAA